MKMVELSFDNLWIEDDEGKLSLSRLPDSFEPENRHIHGELVFKVEGVQLPYMGYFGDDDVCFNTWLYELIQVSKLNDNEEYIFDEGEQGQPAYKFHRRKNTLYISIIDSLLTGQLGDSEWQNKSCDFNQFKEELDKLVCDFSTNLKKVSSSISEKWMVNNVRT